MSHRKIVFLDIDGTLCVAGHNVPPASALEAVRAAQRAGHTVVLCSGRNCGMLAPLLAYGFDGVVASAGGYIEVNGQVIFDCPMTPDQLRRAREVLDRNGVFYTVESKLSSYTDPELKMYIKASPLAGANSELLRWREALEQALNIRPLAEYQGEPVYKIVLMSPNMEALAEPMRLLGEDFDFCIQDTDSIGMVNGELINKKFNKGTAVRRLAAHLGIPVEDTVAFGDSMNDREMIETAGLGVCMENGSPQLKALADLVCPAVEKDGLARGFAMAGLI